MTAASIYRSPDVRESMLRWYDRFLERVPGSPEGRVVETAFGPTHVLVAGPRDAPPLVCVHGALASSAHVVGELAPLTRHYRVVAPDVVGQSVKSAEVRPPVKGPAYARWLGDVMDAMDLATAPVLGVSWGGFVALKTAMDLPERVDKLVLLVPAGLVTGSGWAQLTRVGWPMMRYRRAPTPERLERALRHLFTTMDPDWVAFMGEALRGVKLDFRLPPRAKPADLVGFDAPTLVVAADRDIQFPGGKLLRRAAKVIPNLAATELLEGCMHSPPFEDGFRETLCGRIRTFLETGA